jgi:hypothetical protein
MLAGGLRTMSVFFTEDKQESLPVSDALKESPPSSMPATPARRLSWSYLAVSTLVVLFFGLFPGLFLPLLDRLVLMFEQLGG